MGSIPTPGTTIVRIGQPNVRAEQDPDWRYLQAVDENTTGDWSILDDFFALDFVAHNPPLPGVPLNLDGMKQATEIFRVASPGAQYQVKLQVSEDDLVGSHILGQGLHAGPLLGVAPTNRRIETEGIAIHRIRNGKIVEYWSVTDVRNPPAPRRSRESPRCSCGSALQGAGPFRSW